MIGYYNYTVVATFLGLVSGVFGMLFAFTDKPLISLCLLMICGAIDMFDGKIAKTRKRTDAEKRFGIQIDSLSDLICFGVLPACIGYSVGMRHPAFWIVLAAYVLAALIRLAYFNVSEEDRQKETTECRRSYEGLPVTCCSFILPMVYLLHGRMQPVATDRYPVYHRNTREYTVLHTDHFGEVIQMEVGALMVGRICNHRNILAFARGDEKGYFEFGGSTVILIFRKGAVTPDPEFFRNTAKRLETVVRQGEWIGTAPDRP